MLVFHKKNILDTYWFFPLQLMLYLSVKGDARYIAPSSSS
jgi:hypothetical protein